MILRQGAARIFGWLKDRQAGEVHERAMIRSVTGWSEVSLKTYLGKNKLAPFLLELSDGRLKVLTDGRDLSEAHFHETFTQAAPRKVTLSPGDCLFSDTNKYTLVEPLGSGAVGNVWSARVSAPKAASLVAVKIMLPREDLLDISKLVNVRERFRREAANGQTLRHPNIVRYFDTGAIQENPFLVMELADASVGKHLKHGSHLDPVEVDEIVYACIAGLGYLHDMDCPHRDVKPDNILSFEEGYKLGDLGIVKWSDFDPAFTKGGTITRASVQLGSWFYMAPEQQQDPHEATPESDIYALGVSWIEMLTGTLPAPQAIGAGAYEDPSERAEICALIARMVAYSPAERPSLEEISAATQPTS